jgi:hypothetical protein
MSNIGKTQRWSTRRPPKHEACTWREWVTRCAERIDTLEQIDAKLAAHLVAHPIEI